jgi:hypothetical protein
MKIKDAWSIVEMLFPKRRIRVILINQELGY